MTTQLEPVSKKMMWAGYIMSAAPVLLLLMSAIMKLMKAPVVMQGFAHYGYTENVVVPLGMVELLCTVVYIIPRTSILGAILLTGYLGGATATLVRAGDAWFMPVAVGVLVWGGLHLRHPRLRALIPFFLTA